MIFFTGLSASGKSTIANGVMQLLNEHGGRPVTLMDGDIVRTHLSQDLGFSKRDRDTNISRVEYIVSLIARNRGAAVCSFIAPYEKTRNKLRTSVVAEGGAFVLVHVSTPLEICLARDPKGLYEKAKAGLISEFTGISDPYEVPQDPELRVDTAQHSMHQCVHRVLLYLQKEGFLDPSE